MTLVELCCGTASVSLWALAGLKPLTGFMGSKRADAPRLCEMLLGGVMPDRVILVDSGPWGDVWRTLSSGVGRFEVATLLRMWDERGRLPDVWPDLLYPPRADAAERAAQYLCLQARSASCVPVWWSSDARRWESPSGSPSGVCALAKRSKGGRQAGPARGLVRIETLAERVDALAAIDWSRVEVITEDVGAVRPVPGSVVYLDPPYEGAPRYASLCPRSEVLRVAKWHAAAADLVVVSEGEPLPLHGWRSERLRAGSDREWLSICGEVRRRHGHRPALQLQLDEGAA